MIVLVGRCGLERLAKALRSSGEVVAVLPGTNPGAIEALHPELVYADIFDREWMRASWNAALGGGGAPTEGLALARAELAALERFPLVLRGVRWPPAGSGGLEGIPLTAMTAWSAAETLLQGRRVIDVAGLWARHGIVQDAVRFGVGHGEPELGERGESRLGAGQADRVEAAAVLAWLASRRGPLIKAIVVDLDDTLIHGEIAAPDFARVNPAWSTESAIDADTAFWAAPRGLHDALRVCRSRGIALALCSRNDPALVRARFRLRPELREDLCDLDSFDVVEVGFGPKSAACRRIARRLGVALDSLTFLDDSPVERAEVEANAPGVRVLGGDVAGFRETLLTGPGFFPWARTEAAGLRAGSWRSGSEALDAAAAGDAALTDFLGSLELVVEVRRATEADASRIEELLLRTHQLRLTGLVTIDPGARVYVAHVRDRLTAHGLVAVGWFSGEGSARRLGELAVSCRVLPHRVAGSILALMLEEEPGALVERVETVENAASAGLVEESSRGPASWIRAIVHRSPC
ncbi:MAG: HAD-IIIC family phosphatase [Myxococcales bacterium]|nr:HAD-IIIC family phosphatase [Myxococcales bacterium]